MLALCVICIMSVAGCQVTNRHVHALHCTPGRIWSYHSVLCNTVNSSIGYADCHIAVVYGNGEGSVVVWLLVHMSTVLLPGSDSEWFYHLSRYYCSSDLLWSFGFASGKPVVVHLYIHPSIHPSCFLGTTFPFQGSLLCPLLPIPLFIYLVI